ncbi:MAG: 50S ribosomal protein L30 [Candidatus Dasytiphilus stammeri]
MDNFIQITQIRSAIGCLPKHKATLRCLGLRHIGHTVQRKNTPAIRGMLIHIYYMVTTIVQPKNIEE